jgi:hypothetical protein
VVLSVLGADATIREAEERACERPKPRSIIRENSRFYGGRERTGERGMDGTTLAEGKGMAGYWLRLAVH